MRLIMVTLVPHGRYPVSEPLEAEVTDVMWASATPEARLEHVSIRSGNGFIHLGFYSRLDGAAAVVAVTAICRRVLASSPALYGWELTTLRAAPENPDFRLDL